MVDTIIIKKWPDDWQEAEVNISQIKRPKWDNKRNFHVLFPRYSVWGYIPLPLAAELLPDGFTDEPDYREVKVLIPKGVNMKHNPDGYKALKAAAVASWRY